MDGKVSRCALLQTEVHCWGWASFGELNFEPEALFVSFSRLGLLAVGLGNSVWEGVSVCTFASEVHCWGGQVLVS